MGEHFADFEFTIPSFTYFGSALPGNWSGAESGSTLTLFFFIEITRGDYKADVALGKNKHQ